MLSKKEKINLVKWYYGSTMKDARKWVEDYDRDNPNGRAYEYMLDFMKAQGRLAFLED